MFCVFTTHGEHNCRGLSLEDSFAENKIAKAVKRPPTRVHSPALNLKFQSWTSGRCYDQNFSCDSRQFSAKKMAFFSKANAMIRTLHNLVFFESNRNFWP
jgi:hypothetical protein